MTRVKQLLLGRETTTLLALVLVLAVFSVLNPAYLTGANFLDILDRFEKSRLVDYAAADRTELFNWFLLPGLALLLLEILLSQTWLRRFP